MGLFSSKTVTYVSSSTSPMFDRNKRVDNFQAAMIDHTSTLSMEQSEYLRSHYNSSRLRNFRGLQNWAERSGFYSALGRITTVFYGDAKFDLTQIAEALKPLITLPENLESYGVYNANLAFFSEDFWIKHLATQQGKANLFYNPVSSDYTISYPSEDTIKATFKNGKVVQGKLPSYTNSTRFLEISYSIIKKKIEETPGATPEDPPVTVVSYDYDYCFYSYQEGTGSTELDNIIKNNGIHGTQSFYPVIPLRTNTWWITDGRAKHINAALKQLELYDIKKGADSAFAELRSNCESGMKEGNIGDIDYITLLLGVTINSRNRADQRYLFEFFFNCYTNYALSIGHTPQSMIGGKPIYTGRGNLGFFFKTLVNAITGGQDDNYYTKFQLYNPTSNFNYTYGWLASDYFEANGKFKPDAKVGDYGTLAGQYVYTYRHQVPARDDEGNIIVKGDSESGYEVVMEWETVTSTYNLTFFCHQTSVNRWKTVAFADLKLVNLVYAGKHINTDAYQAVKDSDSVRTLDHDFSGDYDGAYETWKILNFTYVENPGNSDSAFVVPLEQNTLHDVGIKNALDISYGCYFLVFNCWVQKKKKWYQNGFFGMVIGFIGMVVFPIPILASIFTTIFIVSSVVTALQMTTKLLSLIVGDRWATKLVSWAIQIVKTVLNVIASIAFKIPVIGWLIWGICMTAIFVITAAEVIWQGGTWQDALKQGLITSAISGAATAIGGSIGGSESLATVGGEPIPIATIGSETIEMSFGQAVASSFASSFTESALSNLFAGKSFGDSLLSGFKSGAISAAKTALTFGLAKFGFTKIEAVDYTKFANFGVGDWLSFGGDLFMKNLVNPNTFSNLMQMGLEERMFHKMANLENDYQEFNNKAQAANKVLNQLAEAISGTITAETVCRMQACLGRTLTAFPDTVQSMDPEATLSLATLAGSDTCKAVLGNIDCWCDSQITMDGYSPSDLHYSTFSNTMTWDASLRTGT